ncbi:MAG: hypothetical protein IPN90_13335 [Elusimicrobia bacterium]|nr:hypothetical protein [Elusimicrobiota bacterium]
MTARRDGDGKIVGDAKEDGLREVGEVWGFDEWYSRNLYETRSVYGVRRGQAVVVKSETRSYAADDGGVRLGELEHGYNESWSTVWNRYTEGGQLEGAVGWTVGKSTVEVVKDTRVGDGLMAQRTESMTKNEYGVVMGQAVVMRSETQSWGAGSDGKRVSDSSAHGYTRSVTRVENRYDVEGQLTNVRGWTDTLTTQGTYKSVEDWGERCWAGKRWWWCLTRRWGCLMTRCMEGRAIRWDG